MPPDRITPLGSAWKMFAYFYLSETGRELPPYSCRGKSPEEVFCCKPGGSIGMEEALAKSCGLFFSPKRLGLGPGEWGRFWKERMRLPYPWLADLDRLPHAEAPVSELLGTLQAIRARGTTFDRLYAALAGVLVEGTARAAVGKLGSSFRVKTFTLADPAEPGGFVGGFAGWLPDGAAVWALGRGTSAAVVRRWAGPLAALADAPASPRNSPCVKVRFFTRYPLSEVRELPSGVPARDGPLHGRFRALFRNGNAVEFASNGEAVLRSLEPAGRAAAPEKGMALSASLDMNEYVARVLEREVRPVPEEAAKAFAVAIRTYLVQNAPLREGCYAVPDSTRFQRVSVNPAGAPARRVAAWTDGIILDGARVRYRVGPGAPGALSWEEAVRLSGEGLTFDRILRSGYPAARLAASDRREAPCRRLEDVEAWLASRSKDWRRRMAQVPGFEPPAKLQACRTAEIPHSDPKNGRLYLRPGLGTDHQIVAAHEYLHLALQSHPAGSDEPFIERTARELVAGKAALGIDGSSHE